jgi:hypothetical protein
MTSVREALEGFWLAGLGERKVSSECPHFGPLVVSCQVHDGAGAVSVWRLLARSSVAACRVRVLEHKSEWQLHSFFSSFF